ncbi:MAG: hypothetical protein ABIE74_01120 [Pseudomonadota bacterium]
MVSMAAQFDQMRNMTEDLVETYCTRVAAISDLISGSYEMMERYKEDREKICQELKEILAVKNSLRRKDFDILMHDALEPQSVCEKQIRETLHSFLVGQKVLSTKLKEALHACDLGAVRNLKGEIEREIDLVKQVVVFFHDQQTSLLQGLKTLLSKGSQLTVNEFKVAMNRIRKEFTIATTTQTASTGSAGFDMDVT